MSFQELFSVDDMQHAEGWRKLLCNTWFSTIVTLVCGFVLAKIGLYQHLAAVWFRPTSCSALWSLPPCVSL